MEKSESVNMCHAVSINYCNVITVYSLYYSNFNPTKRGTDFQQHKCSNEKIPQSEYIMSFCQFKRTE